MNKNFCLVAILTLAFSVSWADDDQTTPSPAASSESPSPWVVGVGPLLSTPVQDINPLYKSGIGGKGYLGYVLNRDVVFQLDLDNIFYSSGSYADYELRAIPTVKFLVGEGGLRPYLTGGLGVDFQFASSQGQSALGVSTTEAAGLGVQYQLTNETRLFLEGKYCFIFSRLITGQDLPVILGAEFNL